MFKQGGFYAVCHTETKRNETAHRVDGYLPNHTRLSYSSFSQ